MKQSQNKYASLSLISTIVAGTFTSIHHVFEIGYLAVILVLLFIVTPTLLMQWFRKTGSKVTLWVYGILITWFVVGLGLIDGLFNHTVKIIGFYFNALLSFHGGGTAGSEKTLEGNFIFQFTGMLTFFAGIFVAYYGYKFIRTSRRSRITSEQNND